MQKSHHMYRETSFLTENTLLTDKLTHPYKKIPSFCTDKIIFTKNTLLLQKETSLYKETSPYAKKPSV